MDSVLYSQPVARYTDGAVREAPWTEGDVVRKLRLVAGWKLKHLAKNSGVSLTMIHELEMGKTKEAKRATLTRIAAARGKSPYEDAFLDVRRGRHPSRIRFPSETEVSGHRFRGIAGLPTHPDTR